MWDTVFTWMLDHWGFSAFIIGCLFQFTPVKVRPFTALFKWIGHIITGEVAAQLSDLKDEVRDIKLQRITDEKDRIRYEVLAFSNSCRNGFPHAKDEFLHIFELNDKYERLLELTDDHNGVFTAEYEYIKDLYRKCQAENDFLA